MSNEVFIVLITLKLQVFSTLSFSGSGLFSRMNRIFDVVVIDEAAQAVSGKLV